MHSNKKQKQFNKVVAKDKKDYKSGSKFHLECCFLETQQMSNLAKVELSYKRTSHLNYQALYLIGQWIWAMGFLKLPQVNCVCMDYIQGKQTREWLL